MAIQYLIDRDLAFLQRCSEDDLHVLASYLTHDTDGKERFTGSLMSDENFKNMAGHPERCRKCWDKIAGELQLFGGDTVANIVRGTGILYKEIVSDVCDRMNVKYQKNDDPAAMEMNIFSKIGEDLYKSMDDVQKQNFARRFGQNDAGPSSVKIAGIAINSIGVGLLITQIAEATALKMAGQAASSLIAAQVSARAIAALGASQVIGRVPSLLLGPMGIVLTAILSSIPVITGAAYRVTIPSVIHVGYMRRKMLHSDEF